MTKVYNGSCHCKNVTYKAEFDLTAGTLRCNCTFCRKTRNWVVRVPAEQFDFTAGSDLVSYYRMSEKNGGKYAFCPKCGIRLGTAADPPNGAAFFNLAVATLDDVTQIELIGAPIKWVDGLNDNWAHKPNEVRHL